MVRGARNWVNLYNNPSLRPRIQSIENAFSESQGNSLTVTYKIRKLNMRSNLGLTALHHSFIPISSFEPAITDPHISMDDVNVYKSWSSIGPPGHIVCISGGLLLRNRPWRCWTAPTPIHLLNKWLYPMWWEQLKHPSNRQHVYQFDSTIIKITTLVWGWFVSILVCNETLQYRNPISSFVDWGLTTSITVAT